MPPTIHEILGVLKERDIEPNQEGAQLPDVGEFDEGEAIYATSLDEVFRTDDGDIITLQEGRLDEWWREIEDIISRYQESGLQDYRPIRKEPPEPHCAWYCPIHFFGHAWGIYIRESCILSTAVDIARAVPWRRVSSPLSRRSAIARQLLRSAFYVFFLHEQFHHKVESLGFRLLIATGTDRYRPYKANVYRPSYLSVDCLEESLANAESYRRLQEERYRRRHEKPMLDGVRRYLRVSFTVQPPGYAQAVHYLRTRPYRDGLYRLKSQVRDGTLRSAKPVADWEIAPNMITALMDISEGIYVVLPRGARPIFNPTSFDPGATVSSRDLIGALTRHYGYHQTPGGKGSHVKLTKPGAPNIHVPGNRPVVSPGVVKQVLGVFGGHPLSRLPDLLEGKLPII
jgi:hypothetical protein